MKDKKRFWIRKVSALLSAGCVIAGMVLCGCDGTGQAPKKLTKESNEVICMDGVSQDDTSVWDFSWNLFQQNLTETNPVMSPVSAYFAMSMTGAGAKGQTREEFHHVFGQNMINISGDLMQKLPAAEENLQVKIANSVWVDEDLEAKEQWLDLVSDLYKGEVYQIPLTSAMKPVNEWVEEQTEGLIDSILNEPPDELARLLLVNAIYFNGKWETPFAPEATGKDLFTKEDQRTVNVDMMRSYGSFIAHIRGQGVDGVVLPYLDGDYAFVAIKPTRGQTIREAYANLSPEQIRQMMAESETVLMNLKLPKFEVEYDKILNEDFIQMGLPSAFESGKADLSDIGTSKDGLSLFISLVRQKAVIKVDEEGTEAAAVTAVVCEAGGAMPVEEPIDMFFDEPFFYMIYDTETEVPLFMGIFEEPIA